MLGAAGCCVLPVIVGFLPPPPTRPAAGFSSAPWEEVAAFYAQWGGFATVKDFAWADQYNPASAPNRKARLAAGAGKSGAARGYSAAWRSAAGASVDPCTAITLFRAQCLPSSLASIPSAHHPSTPKPAPPPPPTSTRAQHFDYVLLALAFSLLDIRCAARWSRRTRRRGARSSGTTTTPCVLCSS